MRNSTSVILENSQQGRGYEKYSGNYTVPVNIENTFLVFGPLCTQVSFEVLIVQVHVVIAF